MSKNEKKSLSIAARILAGFLALLMIGTVVIGTVMILK